METDWIPDREEVIQVAKVKINECPTPPFQNVVRGFYYTPQGHYNRVWVKYFIYPRQMKTEADTQIFVREALLLADQQTRSTFYIPQVFDVFQAEVDDLEYGMIVMEYIQGTPMDKIIWSLEFREVPSELLEPGCKIAFLPTESEDDKMKANLFKDKIVDFISFLLSLHPTPETGPGPHGGGRILNQVFGADDNEAPEDFSTLDELEDYINDAITDWRNSEPGTDEPETGESETDKSETDESETDESEISEPETVDFKPEGLKLCCCDLDFSNFIMEDPSDPASRMSIIDFEQTNWLPYSFLIWALWRNIMFNPSNNYLLDGILSKSHLTQNKDNVYALDTFSQALEFAARAMCVTYS